jgi:hypothetical protein
MSGVTAVMLVVLALAAPLRTPDLQVEAVTASGAGLPELAEAVARALVAGGARVVLRGPSSSSCEYCAKVRVTETAPGECEVAIEHEQHAASTRLRLPAGSQLFDRARAIAIQARVLMTWRTSADGKKPKEVAARPAHKPDPRWASEATRPVAPPVSAKVDPYLATRRQPMPTPESSPAAPPVSISAPAPMVPVPGPAEVPPLVTYTSRSDGNPASPSGTGRPLAGAEAKPVQADATASLAQSESKPSAPAAKPRSDAGRASAADLVASRTVGGERSRWPWIPTVIGGGAAIAAGICAAQSRGHYDALADKNQSVNSATSHKSAGERWQTASLVLAGVAVAAVGTGIIGFATASSDGASVTALAAPIPGGGMLALSGQFR